ncbi:MAG: peptide chain release factor N(5)-glutamine methyltransferase [Chloroflexota bacterium]
MTLAEALRHAREMLVAHQIEEANFEAELLLRHTLGKSRAELYLDLNQDLGPNEATAFWQLIERRLGHEPTAYITGHREFYGLDFYVDRRVLIPRPESELLVEKALAWATGRGGEPALICEIGTGSGAIAITLAWYLPRSQVYATDISPGALEVAARNCRQHGVAHRVKLLGGNLLETLPEPVDLIVANLPYLSRREIEALPPEIADYEPRLALDGGETGLDRIMALSDQLPGRLRPGGLLLLEVGTSQAEALSARLRHLMPQADVSVTPDLSGAERVVSLTLPC